MTTRALAPKPVRHGDRSAPAIARDALRSPERPLDAATRHDMERRLGHAIGRVRTYPVAPQLLTGPLSVGREGDQHERDADRIAGVVTGASPPDARDEPHRLDLGAVRIHTGPQAEAAAASVGARAFTVGSHVVFGAGAYAPHTAAGRGVLAHELAHVVQQTRGLAPLRLQRLTAEEKKEDLQSERLRGDARLQRAFDDSPVMRSGESGAGVKTLQRALRDLGYDLTKTFAKGDADGTFGDETVAAVKAFQRDQSLGDNGVVGRDTLRALDALYSITLTLTSVRFTSDHGVLLDNRASWDGSGPRFPKPEWTPASPGGKSAPISHDKDALVTVELRLDVGPESVAVAPVGIKGTSSEGFLSFSKELRISGGKDQAVSLISSGSVPDQIDDQYLARSIVWSADVHGSTQPLATSVGHDVFVTYGPPRGGGVTYKRMAKATELTKGFGNKPHDIVSGEMKRFASYNLQRPYRGNVWLLADAIPDSGECQAIVRFVQAVNDTVGVPGTARGICVYASPNAPDVPLVGTLLVAGGADHGMFEFPPQSGTNYRVALFDGGDNANNYEAALEFDFGGKLYYPGGVPGGVGVASLDQVLHSFTKMAWGKVDTTAMKLVPVVLIHCYRPPC
jgi:peptidoglycan hydrolase-like protein with peptidoglycan-binding domain